MNGWSSEKEAKLMLPVSSFTALETFTMSALKEKAKRVHEQAGVHRFTIYDHIHADADVLPGYQERFVAVKLGKRGYAGWGMRFLVNGYSLDTPSPEMTTLEFYSINKNRKGECWGSLQTIQTLPAEYIESDGGLIEKIDGMHLPPKVNGLDVSQVAHLQGKLEALYDALEVRRAA